MKVAETLHGAMLFQRGTEDLVTIAGGATGSSPDTGCTLGTRFQIASISKQFTATAVLLLADRGVLPVDDPVREWLDDCPASWTASPCITCSAILPAWSTGVTCPGWT